MMHILELNLRAIPKAETIFIDKLFAPANPQKPSTAPGAASEHLLQPQLREDLVVGQNFFLPI